MVGARRIAGAAVSVDLYSLPESEAIVVAAAIQTRGTMLDETTLQPMDFLTNAAGWAWEALRLMYDHGTPIDAVSVTLMDPRCSDWVLANSDQPTHGAEWHADRVLEAAQRRRLRDAGMAIVERSKVQPLVELIDGSRSLIDQAVGLQRQPISFVGDHLASTMAAAAQPSSVYPTPWGGLNDNLGGGLRPGALYVLAARPALGKSALALQMAASLADYGIVGLCSLEMPQQEVIRRLIAQGTELPHHLFERGQPLPPYAQAKYDEWAPRAPVSIAIDDRSTITVADVRSYGRSLAKQGPLAGMVVDYLQLLSGPANASRVEIVSEVTRQLKIMARDLNCPVIALSQLNRESEKRMDRRPQLSDLRESGSIEQDADAVLMLYRDPMFAIEQNMAPGAPPLMVPLDVIVAKNRHGSAGQHTLKWEGSWMRAY